MELFIQRLSRKQAVEILNWKYPAPYNFYNNEENEESIKELLGSLYSVVIDENGQIIGFFCTGDSAQVPAGNQYGAYSETCIDIGLGMKPELTGKGLGLTFFSFILGHIQGAYKEVPLRLTVAKFNDRAIRLYEKLGFKRKIEFSNGSTEFMTMIKDS